jgi:hypothetical protein
MMGTVTSSRGAGISIAVWMASVPAVLSAQRPGGGDTAASPLPAIEDRVAGLDRMEGFLPLYWDSDQGRLWMEIPRLGEEMIHYVGFGAGLGSNDLGLDRGALRGSEIVRFERVGRKVLMVEPNYRFRATSGNPAEVRAVRDAFARSVLWGFTAGAETGDRILVDATDYLLRDAVNAAQSMRPGTYRLDPARSSVYMEATDVFPTNTEMEAELTFVLQSGGGGGGGFGGSGGGFEGVGSVAASGAAPSIRLHHSFVQLPDDGFEPRVFDPRAGYGATSFQDYAAPLGESMTRRFIRRHRLEKRDPTAPVSDPVEPIVYYLDPGTPEPIRSALLEGARWWNQAFTAVGYRDAFQVVLRPDSISPLDARYNVINWVHRSTRGWSTGGSVSDPRTGEIVKGVVTLGSLRIRQDYMIAEGLLSPYASGDETPPELAEWALARVRQLAAHEVGHTLGLGHNYYNSAAGRVSVMDYPHPFVTLRPDGTLDHSEVYDVGIGEWDAVAIAYGYQDFPDATDERSALAGILSEAWEDDLRYMTNQDIGTTPQADQWANGTDMADELIRSMEVRDAALSRFGERVIRNGMPMATLEEALVPLYLHHRYQVEATASAVAGVEYVYALRGDGRRPFRRVHGDAQRRALDALARTLRPSELTLPSRLLDAIPPRPPGYGRHREMFPRYTGGAFDAVTPAVVAAAHTAGSVLTADRAARLVEQHALDPSLPGLEDVLAWALDASFGAPANGAYEEEVRRAVEDVVVRRIEWLASNATMPHVRAVATVTLRDLADRLGEMADPWAVGTALDIRRFLGRPAPTTEYPAEVDAPPGAPIGQPALDWLELDATSWYDPLAWGRYGPGMDACTWTDLGW